MSKMVETKMPMMCQYLVREHLVGFYVVSYLQDLRVVVLCTTL
jgi:hypothetical protein